MKIVFNGLIEEKKTGCVPCGTSSKTKMGYVNSKMYILPSGLEKKFYVGRVEEVSQRDGEFLLKYVYRDGNGTDREVFSKVD